MRGFLKMGVVSTAIAILIATPLISAAKPQPKVSEALKACRENCKSEKDTTVYEGCMIKCENAEKVRNPRK